VGGFEVGEIAMSRVARDAAHEYLRDPGIVEVFEDLAEAAHGAGLMSLWAATESATPSERSSSGSRAPSLISR
jgi:hypothetical protein